MLLAACTLAVSTLGGASISEALVTPNPHVLVFSKTAGFRHDSIPVAVDALKSMASKRGFTLEHSEDSSVFTPKNLSRFDSVLFLSTTGDILNDAQQNALYGFVEGGGGFLGVHAAADTEYDWPKYLELAGAYFKRHPQIQEAATIVEDPCHPSTYFLPARWVRTDEWYDYRANPRGQVRVLASLDPNSYQNSDMKDDHPISWCGQVGLGRTWYTGMGHTKETFSERLFMESLYNAIVWTSQKTSPAEATKVNWKAAKGWVDDQSAISSPGGPVEYRYSAQSFGDALIHVEFKLPKGSNSGVYIQSRYEIQIFDSFGKSKGDLTFSDAGGIYERWKDGKGYEGTAPSRNALLEPGQWNTLDVLFRAPRFDGDKKVENARMVDVRLNGVVIHSGVSLTGPTRGKLEDEVPSAPLILQGDHGPVSFRNIWVIPQRLR